MPKGRGGADTPQSRRCTLETSWNEARARTRFVRDRFSSKTRIGTGNLDFGFLRSDPSLWIRIEIEVFFDRKREAYLFFFQSCSTGFDTSTDMGTNQTLSELRDLVSLVKGEEKDPVRTRSDPWMVPVGVDVDHPTSDLLHGTFLWNNQDGRTKAEVAHRVVSESKLPTSSTKEVDDSLKDWISLGRRKSVQARLALLRIRVFVEGRVLVDDVCWNLDDPSVLPETYASVLVHDLGIQPCHHARIVRTFREQLERVRRSHPTEDRSNADPKWELPRLLLEEEYRIFQEEERERDLSERQVAEAKRKRESEEGPSTVGARMEKRPRDGSDGGWIKCRMVVVDGERIALFIDTGTGANDTEKMATEEND